MIAPPEVVEAFTSAVIAALQELVAVEAFPGSLTSADSHLPSGEIVSAEIALKREPAGSMALWIGADTAAQLAARYLPQGSVISAEIIDDVAGEFANVIAGQSKTLLKGTGYHFHLSTPQITRLHSREQPGVARKPAAILHFDCDLGPITLIVDLPPSSSQM